jgi:ribosome-associated protein
VQRIEEVPISGQSIRLGQLLKLSGLAESGGASKQLLEQGVRVNGTPETRRGRQLHDGDVVELGASAVRVVTGERVPQS